MERNKTKKIKKNIIITIVIILVLLLGSIGGYCWYKKSSDSGSKTTTATNETQNTTSENAPTPEPETKGEKAAGGDKDKEPAKQALTEKELKPETETDYTRALNKWKLTCPLKSPHYYPMSQIRSEKLGTPKEKEQITLYDIEGKTHIYKIQKISAWGGLRNIDQYYLDNIVLSQKGNANWQLGFLSTQQPLKAPDNLSPMSKQKHPIPMQLKFYPGNNNKVKELIEYNYATGKKTKHTCRYENGNPETIEEFDVNEKTTKITTYYNDGPLFSTELFNPASDSKVKYESFYKKGNKKSIKEYNSQGKKTKEEEEFYENGKTQHIKEYDVQKDKKIRDEKFDENGKKKR